MSFNTGADLWQRVAGGGVNVPVVDDDWINPLSRRDDRMGEYVLVEAILREAIREYQKFAGQRTRRGSRLFREVDEWFSEDDRQWDFSFVNICQILDLEPSYIRAGLKLWWNRNVQQTAEANMGKPAVRGRSARRDNVAAVRGEPGRKWPPA